MAQAIIYPYGNKTVSVPVGQSIIIGAYEGTAKIYLGVSDPNMPTTFSFSQEIENTEVTLGTYSAVKQVQIDAGPGKVYYNIGASPTISLPTSNTIAGTGDPTTLIGESAAQGGAIAITGGTSSTAGNDGGAVTITGGTAAAHTTGTGGDGGAASFVASDGADATGAAGIGGAGGAVAITAGDGGDATDAASGVGGAGANITLTPGSGGTSTGSTDGAAGQVVSAGLFALNTAQVLDMSDATVQLTVNPSTTAGTLLTSNVMRVDPNSSGAGEDLELPPEADVPGLVLWIYNTGGENIVIKDDSGGTTIDTIATTEFGFFYCDGTAWHGMNAA